MMNTVSTCVTKDVTKPVNTTIYNGVTALANQYGLVNLMDSKHLKQQTLLLVDDEENVLNALKRLLRSGDYEVVTASSGAQALSLMANMPIDMVISDARMPEMNGVELLTTIANEYPETERVLLTGYADLETTINAINNASIAQYIQKPWNDEQLVKLVERTLNYLDLKKHTQHLQETIH